MPSNWQPHQEATNHQHVQSNHLQHHQPVLKQSPPQSAAVIATNPLLVSRQQQHQKHPPPTIPSSTSPPHLDGHTITHRVASGDPPSPALVNGGGGIGGARLSLESSQRNTTSALPQHHHHRPPSTTTSHHNQQQQQHPQTAATSRFARSRSNLDRENNTPPPSLQTPSLASYSEKGGGVLGDLFPEEGGVAMDSQDRRRVNQLVQEAMGQSKSVAAGGGGAAGKRRGKGGVPSLHSPTMKSGRHNKPGNNNNNRRSAAPLIESVINSGGESDIDETDSGGEEGGDDDSIDEDGHTTKPINIVGGTTREKSSKGCSIYYLGITGFMMFLMASCVLCVTVLVPTIYILNKSHSVYSTHSETLVQDVGSMLDLEMSRVTGHIDEATAGIEAMLITLKNNIDRYDIFWEKNVSAEIEKRYNRVAPYTDNATIETYLSPYSSDISSQYMLPGLVLPPALSIPVQYALSNVNFLNYSEYVHRLSKHLYEPFVPLNLSNILEMQIRDWVIPTARNLIPKLGCSTFPRTRSNDDSTFLTPHFASLNELAVMIGTSDHFVGVRCSGGNGYDPNPDSVVIYAAFTRNVDDYAAKSSTSADRYKTLEYWEWKVPLLSDPDRTLDYLSLAALLRTGLYHAPGSISASKMLVSTSALFTEAVAANAARTSRAQQGLSSVPHTLRFPAANIPSALIFYNEIGCNADSCIDYETVHQPDTIVVGMVVGIVDISGDYISDSLEVLKEAIVSQTSPDMDFGIYVVDSGGYIVASTFVFDITRSFADLVLSSRTVEGIIEVPAPRSATLLGMNYKDIPSSLFNFTGLIPGYSFYASELLSLQEWSMVNRRLPDAVAVYGADLAASLGAKMDVGDFGYLSTTSTPITKSFDDIHHTQSALEVRTLGLVVFAYVDFQTISDQQLAWVGRACLIVVAAAAFIAVLYLAVSFVLLYPLLQARRTVQYWLWKESRDAQVRADNATAAARDEGESKEITVATGEEEEVNGDKVTQARRVKKPAVWFPFLLTPLAKEVYRIREAFLTIGSAIFETENVLQEIQRVSDELNDRSIPPREECPTTPDMNAPVPDDSENRSVTVTSLRGADEEEREEVSQTPSIASAPLPLLPPIGCDTTIPLGSGGGTSGLDSLPIPPNFIVTTTAVILTIRLRVSTVSSGRRERLLKMFRHIVEEERREEEKADRSNFDSKARRSNTLINEHQRYIFSPKGMYSVAMASSSTGEDGHVQSRPTEAEIRAKALSSNTEAFKRLQKRIDLLIAKEHYILNDLICKVLPYYRGEVLQTDGSTVTIAFATHRMDGQVLSLNDVKSLAVRCVDYILARYIKQTAHRPPTDMAPVRAAILKHAPKAAATLPPASDPRTISSMMWKRSTAMAAEVAAAPATATSINPNTNSLTTMSTSIGTPMRFRPQSSGMPPKRSASVDDVLPAPPGFAAVFRPRESPPVRSSSLNSPRNDSDSSHPGLTSPNQSIATKTSFNTKAAGNSSKLGSIPVELGGVHTIQGASHPPLPPCPYQLSSSKYLLAALDVSRCYRTRLGNEHTYSTMFGDAVQRSQTICDFQRSNFSYIPVVCSDEFARLLAPPPNESLHAAAALLGASDRVIDEDNALPLFEPISLCEEEMAHTDKFAVLGDPHAVPAPIDSISSIDDTMRVSLRSNEGLPSSASFVGPDTIRIHTGPYYCPHHDPDRCLRARDLRQSMGLETSSSVSMPDGDKPRFPPPRPPSTSQHSRRSISPTRGNVLVPPAYGTHQHCAICGSFPREGVQPSLDAITVPIDVLLSTVSVGIPRRQGVLVHAVLTEEILRLDHLNTLGALASLAPPQAVPLLVNRAQPKAVTSPELEEVAPSSPTKSASPTPHAEYVMQWLESELRSSNCILAAMMRRSKEEAEGGESSVLADVTVGSRAVACSAALQLLAVQQFPVFVAPRQQETPGGAFVTSPLVNVPSPTHFPCSSCCSSSGSKGVAAASFHPILGGSAFHPLTKSSRPIADPPFIQFYHILTSIADGHFTEALTRATSLLALSEQIRSQAEIAKRYDYSLEAYMGRIHNKSVKGELLLSSSTMAMPTFERGGHEEGAAAASVHHVRNDSHTHTSPSVPSDHDIPSTVESPPLPPNGSPPPPRGRRTSISSMSLPVPKSMFAPEILLPDQQHPSSSGAVSHQAPEPSMFLTPLPSLLTRRLLQLIETCELQLQKRRKQLGVEAVSREITKSLARGVAHDELLYPSYMQQLEDDDVASSAPSEVFRVCPLYVRKLRPPTNDVPAAGGAQGAAAAREEGQAAVPRVAAMYARNTQCDHGPEGLYQKRELFGWDDSEMMQFFDLNDQEMRERFEEALSSQDIGSLEDQADMAMEAQHRRALGELQATRQLAVSPMQITITDGRNGASRHPHSNATPNSSSTVGSKGSTSQSMDERALSNCPRPEATINAMVLAPPATTIPPPPSPHHEGDEERGSSSTTNTVLVHEGYPLQLVSPPSMISYGNGDGGYINPVAEDNNTGPLSGVGRLAAAALSGRSESSKSVDSASSSARPPFSSAGTQLPANEDNSASIHSIDNSISGATPLVGSSIILGGYKEKSVGGASSTLISSDKSFLPHVLNSVTVPHLGGSDSHVIFPEGGEAGFVPHLPSGGSESFAAAQEPWPQCAFDERDGSEDGAAVVSVLGGSNGDDSSPTNQRKHNNKPTVVNVSPATPDSRAFVNHHDEDEEEGFHKQETP